MREEKQYILDVAERIRLTQEQNDSNVSRNSDLQEKFTGLETDFDHTKKEDEYEVRCKTQLLAILSLAKVLKRPIRQHQELFFSEMKQFNEFDLQINKGTNKIADSFRKSFMKAQGHWFARWH
jgi:hypothetical protein